MVKRYWAGIMNSEKVQSSIVNSKGFWNLTNATQLSYTNKWEQPIRGNVTISYLVVAGGGGTDETTHSGGGGAGGVLQNSISLEPGKTYIITVGSGGTGLSNGSNSVITQTNSLVTAIGGGFGAGPSQTSTGGSGGSGGGATLYGGSTPGNGTSGQGYNGGTSGQYAGIQDGRGGGGGGAGGTGYAGDFVTTNLRGQGGIGVTSSITGTELYFGGGGGGASWLSSVPGVAAGGLGGGGSGGIQQSTLAFNGTVNSGGGAGARLGVSYNGGSGVIIIRSPRIAFSTTGSPTITNVGNDTIYTFNGSGTIVF